MSDALSKADPFDYLRVTVIDVVTSADGRRHQWLSLTKSPGQVALFGHHRRRSGIDWPANLWAGTSISTASSTPRIDDLLMVGDAAATHFPSVEPLLERIDLTPWLPNLHWVTLGGGSGR